MRIWLALIAMSVLCLPTVCAAGSSGSTDASASQVTASKPHVPRLRFKNGPVCMCGNGLTEADIEKADKARQDKEKRSKATKVDQRSERRKQ